MNAELAGVRVTDADQVLSDAVETVFRAEQRHELNARSGREEINGMLEQGIDRCGVADQPNASTPQGLKVGIAEDVEAGSYDRHARTSLTTRDGSTPVRRMSSPWYFTDSFW
jgi:hypothetical protein